MPAKRKPTAIEYRPSAFERELSAAHEKIADDTRTRRRRAAKNLLDRATRREPTAAQLRRRAEVFADKFTREHPPQLIRADQLDDLIANWIDAYKSAMTRLTAVLRAIDERRLNTPLSPPPLARAANRSKTSRANRLSPLHDRDPFANDIDIRIASRAADEHLGTFEQTVADASRAAKKAKTTRKPRPKTKPKPRTKTATSTKSRKA